VNTRAQTRDIIAVHRVPCAADSIAYRPNKHLRLGSKSGRNCQYSNQ